jgi:molybdopterin-binding protein
MNKLTGHIVKQSKVDDLCLLEINVDSVFFKSIIIEEQLDSIYKIGDCVNLLFNETEVVLTKNKNIAISLQNKLICKVESIEQGQLLSVVKMRFNSVYISSIITTDSVERLNINVNDEVLAMIKTNEIMLSKC